MQGRHRATTKRDPTRLLEYGEAHVAGVCYDLVNFFLRSLTRALSPRAILRTPHSICIYRIGNIGDIVCTIPALIAVRKAYPKARITLLTASSVEGRIGAEELLKGARFIDRLWVYHPEETGGARGAVSFARSLRAERFDLWIYLPQELITLPVLLRNLTFTFLCGAKKVVGFELSTIKLWARAQSKYYRFDNEVDRLLNLLIRWRVPIERKVEYELPVTPEIERSAQDIIARHGLEKKTIIGLMPGASYQENRWSLENFAELGKFALARYPNCRLVIFGGPDDRERGNFLKKAMGSEKVIDLSGQLSILETHLLLRTLTLFISNNTGLMHMAALAGVNVIAIFSPMELNGKWAPYGTHAKALLHRERSECDGFYYRRFPGSYDCINAVTAEEVEKEVERVMERK